MKKAIIIIHVFLICFYSSFSYSGYIINGNSYPTIEAFTSLYPAGKCFVPWVTHRGPYAIFRDNWPIVNTHEQRIGGTADYYSDASCTQRYNSNVGIGVSYKSDGCPDGDIKDPITGQCANRCTSVKGESGKIGWNSHYWGQNSPSQYVCSSIGGGCVALAGESLCININPDDLQNNPSLYDCDALYIVQDTECDQSGSYPFCTDSTCTDFLPEPTPEPKPDPEPEPDPDPNPDPEHKPTDPTQPLPDSGEVDTPTDTPKPPSEETPQPDVEKPDLTPDSNGDVVSAIAGMNEDMNYLLSRLNNDNNAQFDFLNNQLIQLNNESRRVVSQIASQQKQDAAIYENTKALIQNLNKDVTSAINENTNAVNGLGVYLGDIAEDVDHILDAITNVDTSEAGISGTCIETRCAGFYDSVYPEGINGIFNKHFNEISNRVVDTITDFMKIDLDNASRPSFSIPVPFYGNYSFDDYINLDWIFNFVRVCMMVSTAFLCRKLMFGG